jgi:hypothetical protein
VATIDGVPPNIREAFLDGVRLKRFVTLETIEAATDDEERAYNEGSRFGEAWEMLITASVSEYKRDRPRFEAICAELDARYGEGFAKSVTPWSEW